MEQVIDKETVTPNEIKGAPAQEGQSPHLRDLLATLRVLETHYAAAYQTIHGDDESRPLPFSLRLTREAIMHAEDLREELGRQSVVYDAAQRDLREAVIQHDSMKRQRDDAIAHYSEELRLQVAKYQARLDDAETERDKARKEAEETIDRHIKMFTHGCEVNHGNLTFKDFVYGAGRGCAYCHGQLLKRIEAWMASEGSPLGLLWEEPPNVTWKEALEKARDLSSPPPTLSGGAPWPELDLYRAIRHAITVKPETVKLFEGISNECQKFAQGDCVEPAGRDAEGDGAQTGAV